MALRLVSQFLVAKWQVGIWIQWSSRRELLLLIDETDNHSYVKNNKEGPLAGITAGSDMKSNVC